MAALPARPPASLDALLADRRVWRGQPAALPPARQPTGLDALDEVLPTHGWPDAALSELLLPADGIGELRLLLPTLARLTQAGRDIVLVAPPWLPYPAGWQRAGVDLGHLHLVDANPREALWATEQCLRGGCLAAVLCWPKQADDRALRRLQVACETGQALGFALRDARAAANPSPAALRLLFERGDDGMRLRVLKCRGGNAPARAIALERLAFPVAGTRQLHSGDATESVRPANDVQISPGCAALTRATSVVARTRPQAASGTMQTTSVQVEPERAPGVALTRPKVASGDDASPFPDGAPGHPHPGRAAPGRATPFVGRARPPGALPFPPVPAMPAPLVPASLPALA